MPSRSPTTLPRFSMAIRPEERDTLSALTLVRNQTASALVRGLLAEAAKRHAAEIEAYKALRASFKRPQETA
jgi:hypothetical protein